MYAIYAHVGVVLGVNVGIYGIHGVSGLGFFGASNKFNVHRDLTVFASSPGPKSCSSTQGIPKPV